MATFSTNQARQIYVAKEVAASPSTKGQIALVAPENADYIYFKYVGVDTPVRSDLLNKASITSARLTHGKNIQKYLHQYEVALDSNVSATPVAGQEYLLRINMLGYASLGIENMYQKYGYVKATTSLSASSFYCKMAKSLAVNFSKETWPIYQFFVSTAAVGSADSSSTLTEVTATTTLSSLSGTYLKMVIREVSGYWKKGTDEDMPQLAQIFTDNVLVSDLQQNWGTVNEVTDTSHLTARTDSVYRQLADMEYFYMGERGDKYRNVGWPYVIATDYMIDNIGVASNAFADASDITGVSIIDIHYSYAGTNEDVQKSGKDLCIIIPAAQANILAANLANAGIEVVKKAYDGTVSVIPAALSSLKVTGAVALNTDKTAATASVTVGSDNKQVTTAS